MWTFMVSGELFELFTVTPVAFPPATMSDLCFYLTNTKQGIYVFYMQKCLWCPRLHSMGCHISVSGSHWNMFTFRPLICFQFCFLNNGKTENKRSAEGVSSGVAEKKCKSVLSVITLQAWGKLVFLRPGLFFSFRAAWYETRFQSMSELFILFVFAVDIPSLISCNYLFR